VKIVDANVLVYSVDSMSADHIVARAWLASALAADEPVGFAWNALLAFIRLTTLRGWVSTPLEVEQAAEIAEAWLASAAAVVVHPTERHLGIVSGLLGGIGVGGNLVNDAHLAALAIEHGGEIVSFDHDFGRFPGVRWRRPGE
jgi:uncharacterized protein